MSESCGRFSGLRLKQALNNSYRPTGPALDTSLALEFCGFGLSDITTDLTAHREKCAPSFAGPQA